MNASLSAFSTAANAEFCQLKRSKLLVLLTIVQGVTFMLLVNLFGMPGAFAPSALIDEDNGYYSNAFIGSLNNAHHSFSIKRYQTEAAAMKDVKKGKLVAIITIPKGFSESIDAGEEVPI